MGVVQRLDQRMWLSRGADQVQVVWRYNAADPYEVVLDIAAGAQWRLARDLLAAGLMEATGLGHVRVWPSGDRLWIRLIDYYTSDYWDLSADLSEMDQLVQDTYSMVPDGSERVDVDAAIARCLRGARS